MQRPFWFGSVYPFCLLCGSALFLGAQPIAAQPNLPNGGGAFAKDAPQAPELKRQVVEFRSEIAPLISREPARAIVLIDAFLAAHPAVAWSDAATLWESKASAQVKLGQTEAALQTYRAGLGGFDAKQSQKAWAAAGLLAGQARLLIAQKDAEGAATLLEEQWPTIARSNANREDYAWKRTREAVNAYVAALDKSGHKAQVPDILAGHLLQSPELLEFAGQDSDLGALLLDIIAERLNKAGRGAEVVSWGRLRYATCRYEVEALDGATFFLGRAWDAQRTQEFGKAQREAKAPNPLREVTPPRLLASETGRKFVNQRASEMEAELAQTGDAKLVPNLVSLYLASEQLGAAMEWAWRGAQANPREPESIAQVCRIFKAADLDLVRAQQFVAWSEGGKGENPVPQFLEQHADAANVGAAKLKPQRERRGREKAALADDWEAVRQAPRGVMLGLVNLGTLEPRAAREAGALTVDDTIRLIQDQSVRNYMSIPDREVIRLGLGAVLEEQLAALPQAEQPKVPPLVQLALADSKRKRGDAGAVPIYEALIAAAAKKRGQKGSATQLYVPLAHLAMFYREQGQLEASAQVWERLPVLLADAKVGTALNWMIPEAYFFAAQAYNQSNQPVKARTIYDRAARSTDSNMASIAIIEGFGRELQIQPDQAEIRLLQLQKEITNSDAQLATQFMLAWAKYKTQDWNTFLSRSKEVLSNYERLRSKSLRQSFSSLAIQTEEAQKWAKLWQVNTIVAESSDLTLRFGGPLQQPIERRLFVDTPTPTRLEVTVEGDTNRISARIEESPWAPRLEDVRHQQIVVVTIAPGEPQAQALIRVADAKRPKGGLEIPVKIALTP